MTLPAVKSLAEWPAGNRKVYEGFCRWLRDGGYSDSTVYLYGRAARLALGWTDDGPEVVDFEIGSPDALSAHLAHAKDAIAVHYGSQATCQTYFKGLAKLAEYVRYLRGEPPPEKEIHWDYYLDPLPGWLAGAVRVYLALQGRNWLPEERYRATCTLLSHLTVFLRWLAERVAFDSAAEITPALWLDYVDGRLDAGIQPSTLNRELRDLQHFLRFLADEGHPVCERMLRVESLDAGSPLPRDVPIDQLRELLRQIEQEIISVSGTTGRTALLDRAWFLLMLHCGLRSGEVRRLKLSDLDLEARRVRIEQSKGLKDRIVCLSQETVAALSAYLAVRGPAAGEHVFVHRHRPMSRTYFEPLQAGFTATPTVGTEPLRVEFTDASTPAGAADQWLWAFGDGYTSTLASPVYTYTQPGVYTVTQWVTDTTTGEADALTQTHYITVALGTITTTITYEYDPLYRLTSATYSSGEVYTYTYDEVGNRVKKGVDGQVTVYTYTQDNRLTNADGVVYDWDNNGNLLDDGVRAYAYDYANRLVQVVSGTFTTTFTYNGDGHRMAKTENSVTTNYVVAVLGLSQVLVETTGGSTTRYVYGHDLLAEYDGTEWTYHLNDGLGSVRQLADASGDVILAQGYTPFGVPLWSEGNGSTGYGFTGERWEAYSHLLFLRARYYEPVSGRFVQKDPWQGTDWRPQGRNGWSYVENSPIGLVDPTGHAPEFSIVFMGMAAGPAVELAKSVYSKAGWLYVCALRPDDGWSPSDEVGDLLRDYVCEYGESSLRTFNADAHLTQQLARSYTIHRLREEFYEGGANYLKKDYNFGMPEFFWATIDTLLESDWVFKQGPPLNITHFLGSFTCRINRPSSDKVGFWIHNVTDLASGSRIPPILGGADPSATKEWTSVEKVLEEHPILWPAPLATVVDFFPVISILEPRLREETGGLLDLEGGGTMEQIFVWQEPYFPCGLPLWPDIQAELGIQ